MEAALGRLHLSSEVALLTVAGIFVGSLVNIPVRHVAREEEQIIEPMAVLGLWGFMPRM